MHKVRCFISHSWKDSGHLFARLLALELDNFQDPDIQVDCWLDDGQIYAGSSIPQEIEAGIQGTQVFVFILSPDSIKSEYCLRELRFAIKLQKPIIYVLFKSCAILPDFIQQDIRFIDCSADNNNLSAPKINEIYKGIKSFSLLDKLDFVLSSGVYEKQFQAAKYIQNLYYHPNAPDVIIRNIANQEHEADIRYQLTYSLGLLAQNVDEATQQDIIYQLQKLAATERLPRVKQGIQDALKLIQQDDKIRF